jgi:hypothetical protein
MNFKLEFPKNFSRVLRKRKIAENPLKTVIQGKYKSLTRIRMYL